MTDTSANETQPPTLVCIPTYNEAENIDAILRAARAALPSADLLVLDDNSPDGTADLAEKTAAEIGQIAVLRRPAKAGLGAAYRAGFGVAITRGYQVVVEMDADFSHDPAELPELVGAVAAGADLAIGSRYVPGGAVPNWPARRLALSRGGNRYTNVVLGLPVHDATAGFRAYRTAVLERIDVTNSRANGYGFQVENAYKVWRAGGAIVELPITFHDRVRGESKMSMRIVIEAMSLVTWWGIRDRVFRRAPRRRR